MPKLTARLTVWTFHHLHRRGIIRAVNSTSSSVEGSPVSMRFESWPRVPTRVVGHFADHHFAELYPARARTFYRQRIECAPVTVSGRRVWIIRYAPSISPLAEAFRNMM